MQTRRETAWKKSRKFGDVKGGRTQPKIPDKIFSRAHSLQRPDAGTELPIYLVDNPSRDFFFPIGEAEIRRELTHLPRRDWRGITHVWLRAFRKAEYEAGELPLAEFCVGSGVRLVTLYPWPRSMESAHGPRQPGVRFRRVLEQYGAELTFRAGCWHSQWRLPALRDFYIEYLLLHEIGHHVDWMVRHWSKANRRVCEEAADQYAFLRTTKRSISYQREGERTSADAEAA